VTMHAGEISKDANNIKKAVEQYGAKRIGHGYKITMDTDLMNKMRERNIHFEVCPTSSLETGGWDTLDKDWQKHPAVSMIANGMKVGFNSDDPAVFNTSLTWQYRIALREMGLTKQCILGTIHDSLRASFLKEDEKVLIKKKLLMEAKDEASTIDDEQKRKSQ